MHSSSERWTGEGETALFKGVEDRLLEHDYVVEEVVELTGYEDNHRLFVVRKPEA